jgi:hypothetical protein
MFLRPRHHTLIKPTAGFVKIISESPFLWRLVERDRSQKNGFQRNVAQFVQVQHRLELLLGFMSIVRSTAQLLQLRQGGPRRSSEQPCYCP